MTRSLSGSVIIVLAVIAALAFAFAMTSLEHAVNGVKVMRDTWDTSLSHADSKHGEDVVSATAVREAMCNVNNPHFRYSVGKSRYVEVCDMQDGHWGLQVWKQYGGSGNNKKWSEITAYSPDEIKSLADVIDMCVRNGWELVQQTWDPVTKTWIATQIITGGAP